MPIPVTLPQMGESVVEGTVERWLVREGERVEKDQTLCEVTTDKVDAEIPAPQAGVVTRILVPEGTTVDVGVELAVIDPQGVESAAPQPRASAPARAEEARATVEAPASAEATARATPLARRIAETRGVPLDEMQGSGTGGRVVKTDVLGYLERAKPAAPPPSGGPAPVRPGSLLERLGKMRVPQYRPREEDTIVPFSPIRRRIAEHMVVSKVVSPHVGTVAEADLHEIYRLRERVKGGFRKEHGFNLTYLPFAVQAVVRGLRVWPRMNSAVVDETIVERRGIHVGVAVETERGLVVPVVRDADRLSLVGLAREIEDLARRARDRELSADDLAGGTFTVSNPGRQGNLYGFAIINQPQVGIVRMGQVVKRPVVLEMDGEDIIAVRPIMYLALSYDHRIIDGVTGNGFLHKVAEELETGDFEV